MTRTKQRTKIATYLDDKGKWHALVTFPFAHYDWDRLEVARASARSAIRRKLLALGEPIERENLQVSEIWEAETTLTPSGKIKTIDFMET